MFPDLLTFIIIVIPTFNLSNCGLSRSGYTNRLSETDWTNYNYPTRTGPGSYVFGYDVEDAETNNIQFRNEERHPNGTVTGEYGYLLPDGNVQKVSYVADNLGYRASVNIIPRGGTPKPTYNLNENQLHLPTKYIPHTSRSLANYVQIPQLSKQYPINMPDYISAHLENKNNLKIVSVKNPSSDMEYYPTVLKAPSSFKNRFENFYVIPY